MTISPGQRGPGPRPLRDAEVAPESDVRQVGDHALAQLRLIRETMEKSGRFTSVPGRSGQAMGIVAIIAAAVSDPLGDPLRWLVVWMAAGASALVIGGWGLVNKAGKSAVPLSRGVGRRFVLGLAPSILVGVALTPALLDLGGVHLLPELWLLSYGAAVIAGGAFSVRAVPLMGAAFLACGLVAAITPLAWSNWILGLGFGGLHLVFGEVIARRHGG